MQTIVSRARCGLSRTVNSNQSTSSSHKRLRQQRRVGGTTLSQRATPPAQREAPSHLLAIQVVFDCVVCISEAMQCGHMRKLKSRYLPLNL
jgi:hypothetical protein